MNKVTVYLSFFMAIFLGIHSKAQAQDAFITTWKVNKKDKDKSITIPTAKGQTYNYTVNWGDDSTPTSETGDATHTYSKRGTYTVSITGTFPQIQFYRSETRDNDVVNAAKLQTIAQWGSNEWASMENAFYTCTNLTITATDSPNLSEVTSMGGMFADATSFNQDISGWDVSSVTDMGGMFAGATSFNKNIANWNVSSVIYMYRMFAGATSFNQDISRWDVSKVTHMNYMFDRATSFNKNIANWNVSSVTYMGYMFRAATSFNQDISGWDVSSVTYIRFMFFHAISFNKNIANWNVSSVINMDSMFEGATLSTKNYDALLISWAEQDVQQNLQFHGGNSNYCNAAAAIATLRSNKGWRIRDGGIASDCKDTFITTWKTTVNGESIYIPTNPDEIYSYTVNWGDGSESSSRTTDATHTYATAGTYTVSIIGTFPQIQFYRDGSDAEKTNAKKLQTIAQWGSNEWASMNRAFQRCENLTSTTTDSPNLSKVTNIRLMFADARYFNQDISGWDVSKVTDMTGMFLRATSFNQDLFRWDVSKVTDMRGMFNGATDFNGDIFGWNVSSVSNMYGMFWGATSFNQDLSGWDVSSVRDMDRMFEGVTLSTENYDDLLISWAKQEVQQRVIFSGGNSNYCNAAAAIATLRSKGWRIRNGGIDCSQVAFITTWKVKKKDKLITIPTAKGKTYNYTVDWGDDSTPTSQTGDATHTYPQKGTYTVSITGTFPQIQFPDTTNENSPKLQTIVQWGSNEWASMEGAFRGCKNVTSTATDSPNLSKVTDMSHMFRGATSFNQGLSEWNVSNVDDMDSMFSGATAFNQDISGWNVKKVKNMSYMFAGAASFNKNIVEWDVRSVTNMTNMFARATAFNQDISRWNVRKVKNMSYMFSDATAFNQDFSEWNVRKVKNMSYMFAGATSFNKNIVEWDVSSVTNMTNMFARATAFNQDISRWNVRKVKNMSYMFAGATSFNKNIVEWDVSSVTNMTNMFARATAFNQDLSEWNVSSVTDMEGMFNGVTLSTKNYDALLISWAKQEVQENVTFSGGSSDYCNAEAARATLESKGWEITDGELDCSQVAFITTWKTTADNQSITIYPRGDQIKYTVNWGDGNIDTSKTTDATHTYATAGTYAVSITGMLPQIQFYRGLSDADNAAKLQTIAQWGTNEWASMEGTFRECINLTSTATDSPNLSGVANMSHMFNGATSFNGDISRWNVSSVTEMSWMFRSATSFNQDISVWNVSSVTTMYAMFFIPPPPFNIPSSFNQNISGWDVSSVKSMDFMFSRVTLSTENYEALLKGWAKQDVQQGVTFDGGNSQYCSTDAEKARAILSKRWTIYDGDYNCSPLVASQTMARGTNSASIVPESQSINGETASIFVYPVPVKEFVNVASNIPIKMITVSSSMGKAVLRTRETSFSMANLSNGLYILHIELEDGTRSIKKVLKE